MAPPTGWSIFSIFSIWPLRESVTRSMLPVPSCGETIKRPFESIVMQTQEPSPGSDERSNSALKPGSTVRLLAEVATGKSSTLPHGSQPNLPRLTA